MKKLTGKIIGDKMAKTKVVSIDDVRSHPIYNKTYKKTTKISAHDEKNEFVLGDIVEIVPVRPISKNKAWRVTKKVK